VKDAAPGPPGETAEQPPSGPVGFRDLSRRWRIVLIAEWTLLGALLSLTATLILSRYLFLDTNLPTARYWSDSVGDLAVRGSLHALMWVTVLRLLSFRRPKVKGPVGWSGAVSAFICLPVVMLALFLALQLLF
jgi:hypothetical protein